MKEKIGETAGKIWNILKQKKEVAISQLPQILKEKELLVYQALGWLAREDKIRYQAKGNRIIVMLSELERET